MVHVPNSAWSLVGSVPQISRGEQFKYVKKTFSKHKEHHIAEFDLKVIVGTTELEFELVSMDGRRYSQNTAKVQVTWADVPAPSPVPNTQGRI